MPPTLRVDLESQQSRDSHDLVLSFVDALHLICQEGLFSNASSVTGRTADQITFSVIWRAV